MSNKTRHVIEQLEEAARKAGAEQVSIEHTKGTHLRVNLQIGSAKRAFIAPSTPSDHRSILNCISGIRRIIREMPVADGYAIPA